ncbi:MAG: serine/threonine-protein kinase [Myxococcota bacterium]
MTHQVERHILPPSATASRPDKARRSVTLPDDLLQRGAGRLRVSAWFAVAAIALAAAVQGLSRSAQFGTEAEVGLRVVILAIGLVLSLAMMIATYLKLEPQKILGLGLLWYGAILLVQGGVDATAAWTEHAFSHGIPAPCSVVLVFPVLVPTPPKRFVLVSLLATALLVPLLLFLPPLVGNPIPGPDVIAFVLVPVLLTIAVATIAASIIYKLGRDLKQARKMGSYQLVAPLGKGGMGEVWRARHGMLAREAAIKLIRHDTAMHGGEDAVRRFQNEARAVASLRSPHTIQLWDFGVTDDGALYYAMELLDGVDFDRLVGAHGAQPPERVVHFLLQACHSLAEAHEVGLVHRDIKPANLFVTRLGRDFDVVKLLDFGLATQPVDERIPDARATVDGMIMGTPAYMAPEQVLGEKSIDGRADLYALGAVAWWLLCGRDLFQATSATQVMFAHVNVEPEAPSKAARMPIPPELDAIVLRCLAKKPADRFADAEALAAALRAVPLADAWTRERAQAWWGTLGKKPVVVPGPADPEPGAELAETRASPAPF